VIVYEMKLSNLDFPDKLENGNTARAEQAILRDKAVAERERVNAETATAAARTELERTKAENEAIRIRTIGKALQENPTFMDYQMMQQLPGIYSDAGKSGNLVITAPNPGVFVTPHAGVNTK
jgi:regulator of protease activity HflC (stomatin/prohibitin superfamily)